MAKRKTLEIYLEELKQQQPELFDQFDFSKAVYINEKTKMKIYCRKHNIWFDQVPYDLLKGTISCSECKKEVNKLIVKKNIDNGRKKLLDFININYPDYYLYDNGSEYMGIRSIVTLINKLDNTIIIRKSAYSLVYGHKYSTEEYKKNLSELKKNSKEKSTRLENLKQSLIKLIKDIYGDSINTSEIDYKGYLTPVKLICVHHKDTPIFLNPDTIRRRLKNGKNLCDKCAEELKLKGDVKKKEEFIEQFTKKFPEKDYDFSESTYVNTITEIKVHCNKHNTDFEITPHRLMNGEERCPECKKIKMAEARRKSEEENFFEYMRTEHPEFDISEAHYVNSLTPLRLICKKHPDELIYESPWNIKYGIPRIQREICPKCTEERNREEAEKEFIRRAKEIHGDKYNYDNIEFINFSSHVKGIKCNKCGKICEQSVASHLNGYNCCSCYHSNSYAELYVNEWLKENNIEYQSEVIHPDSEIHGRREFGVRIDFQLVYNNTSYWIEPASEQHYKFVSLYQKDYDDFLTQVKRDENVRDYCKKNNIIYVEIPYKYHKKEKIYSLLNDIILNGVSPQNLIEIPKIKIEGGSEDE